MAVFSHHYFFKISLLAASVFALISFSSHAQVYKWVDANGKVHFSDKKDQAGKKPVTEIQSDNPDTKRSAANKKTDNWRERNELYKERLANQDVKKNDEKIKKPVTNSGSGIKYDGSNSSNCKLAKDVLSGSVVRSNNYGKPTDKTDIEMAQRDVSMFCK